MQEVSNARVGTVSGNLADLKNNLRRIDGGNYKVSHAQPLIPPIGQQLMCSSETLPDVPCVSVMSCR